MATNLRDAIQHIVVLMLENRSYDHLLGGLPSPPYTNGASSSNTNILNGKAIPQTPFDITQPPNTDKSFTPHHFLGDMMKQIFGHGVHGYKNGQSFPPVVPPTQCGYAADFGSGEVMDYVDQPQAELVTLGPLATNFCVCDNWFCDVPANTMPNRLFMHAATAQGQGLSNGNISSLLTAKTIFEQIDDNLAHVPAESRWGIYSFVGDNNDGTYFGGTINDARTYYSVNTDFFQQVAANTLPFYSFLMPVLNTAPPVMCNSMHPQADVRYAENYVAMVYNALLKSSFWKNTLFIITFDENGGIYDHVPPLPAVSPDGIAYPPDVPEDQVLFDFTLLGPRIPALLISPWLNAGVVDHTQYQNTSILRFIQDLLVPAKEGLVLSLNNRDKHANSIGAAFSRFGLDNPRTDCAPVPVTPGFPWNYQNNEPENQLPPDPHQVELTKEFASVQPGHPDSGRPILREFATYAELNAYREERRQAASQYWLKRKAGEAGSSR